MNLIWSIDHRAWWRPWWSGYTINPLEAGLYDEVETESILKTANYTGIHEIAIPENMVFYAPPVDWEKARCQEVTGSMGDLLVRCNQPATMVIKHAGRHEGPYTMCLICGTNNVTRRHALLLLEKLNGH